MWPTAEKLDNLSLGAGTERRGPVELACECQVNVALLGSLKRHLPSGGLVADKYWLKVTLAKFQCLRVFGSTMS